MKTMANLVAEKKKVQLHAQSDGRSDSLLYSRRREGKNIVAAMLKG